MAVIRLSKDTFLSTDDGIVITEQQAAQIIQTAVLRQKNLTVNDTFAQINGVDTVKIDFNLKTLNSFIESSNGFLVNVYLSTSSGLQRMYKNPIVDPADQSVVRGSFSDYIDMEFDV